MPFYYYYYPRLRWALLSFCELTLGFITNLYLFIYFTKSSLSAELVVHKICSLPINTSMTWEIVRNWDSWETTQTCWIRNSGVRSNELCLIYTITFESHWFRISWFITFFSVPYWQDFFPFINVVYDLT